MGGRAQIQSESQCRSHAALQEVKRHRFAPIKNRSALDRFAEKCAFDPITGCVMWIAVRTAGHRHSEFYGRFWDGERMVLAHRWAAEHIHGHDVFCRQVDHCCPAGPSTLCVQHLKPETAARNRELQHTRPGRPFQELETRQHWLFVQKGIREDIPRPPRDLSDGIPFFLPPAWLVPYLPKMEASDDCPF